MQAGQESGLRQPGKGRPQRPVLGVREGAERPYPQLSASDVNL